MNTAPQTAVYWRYTGKTEWCSGYCSIDAAKPETVKMGRWPGDQDGIEVNLSAIEWKYKGTPR